MPVLQLLGKLRPEDHLSPEVQRQPGQHRHCPPRTQKKKNERKKLGSIQDVKAVDMSFTSREDFLPYCFIALIFGHPCTLMSTALWLWILLLKVVSAFCLNSGAEIPQSWGLWNLPWSHLAFCFLLLMQNQHKYEYAKKILICENFGWYYLIKRWP